VTDSGILREVDCAEVSISCLCITEDRPAFMPWLLWNYDRQTWPARELVVVDSSAEPLAVARDDVRVIHAPHRTGVARKRNLALAHARGDIVAWMDDDDWQHPERLARLARALGDGKPYAGAAEGWFLELSTLRCRRYWGAGQRILFNGAGFRIDAARPVRFPEHLRRASDTSWMNALRQRLRTAGKVVDGPLFFWLCHGANLSNPSHKHRFTEGIGTLQARLGDAAWGDTDAELAALQRRLGLDAGRAVAGEAVEPRPTARVRPRASAVPAAEPIPVGAVSAETAPLVDIPVTAIVKATVQDAAYLGVMVPHMLRQARYAFRERIVVVDPRRAFSGKYRARAAGSQQALERALDELLARGEIDRVLEVCYAPDTVAAVNRAWFGRPDVPTHATSGGHILFYTDGDSWVARALACMARDPRCWLAMTHAGPPVGPPGRSLAGANLRRARWDPRLGVWRFGTASTRFFLTDRQRLRGRLPALIGAQGCLPLEGPSAPTSATAAAGICTCTTTPSPFPAGRRGWWRRWPRAAIRRSRRASTT